MGSNQYDDFKSGIKRDVQGVALSLFAGVGLFLLVFTLGGVLIWFFLKENHYPVEIKATVGLSVLLLVILMLTNRQIGNYIYLLWLKIILIVVILLGVAFLGLILYCFWYLMKDCF